MYTHATFPTLNKKSVPTKPFKSTRPCLVAKSPQNPTITRTKIFELYFRFQIPQTYRPGYRRYAACQAVLAAPQGDSATGHTNPSLLQSILGVGFWAGTRPGSFYPLDLVDFRYNSRHFTPRPKVLALNYPRSRFFPVIRTLEGSTYLALSLGMFAVMFNKGKSFLRNKSVFMAAVGFLRKILLFSSISEFILIVQKTPQYLQETLAALNEPVVNIYKDPFGLDLIVEKQLPPRFSFSMFLFQNNKPYGTVKVKQKGRLKRKIAKRIVSMNRVLD